MTRVDIKQQFSVPVEELYAFLSVHKNMESIFAPAKIKRIKEGSDSPEGLGSVRVLSLQLAPSFEETVTLNEPNQRIEYRITKGSPLKEHHGVMRFNSTESGSELHYTIDFAGKFH